MLCTCTLSFSHRSSLRLGAVPVLCRYKQVALLILVSHGFVRFGPEPLKIVWMGAINTDFLQLLRLHLSRSLIDNAQSSGILA